MYWRLQKNLLLSSPGSSTLMIATEVSSKHQYIFTKPHGVTSQKTAIITVAAVRMPEVIKTLSFLKFQVLHDVMPWQLVNSYQCFKGSLVIASSGSSSQTWDSWFAKQHHLNCLRYVEWPRLCSWGMNEMEKMWSWSLLKFAWRKRKVT